MELSEAKKIVAIMMAAYPNFKPADVELTVRTWAAMLDGYSYAQVSAALKEFVLTDASGFAPSIGQIAAIAAKSRMPPAPGEMEAWEMVRKALGNSGYHSEEEFAKLPPPVQRAVVSPRQLKAWATDNDYNEGVAMARFKRAYALATEQEERAAMLGGAGNAAIGADAERAELEERQGGSGNG